MLRHQIPSSRKAAFTLVELLIVIIIIGILAGSVLLVAGSSTDKAHALKIVNNMKTIKKASMASYADKLEWPGDMSDIAGYVDRGMADYSFESIEESGLYVKADLSGSSSGLKDRLSRMASEMGLYGNTDGSMVTYAGGESVYYHLTRGTTDYSGSGTLFATDFDSDSDKSLFYASQGSVKNWDISDGTFVTPQSGNDLLLLNDFSGTDYTVSTTAQYLNDGNSGYGIVYRGSEDESGTFHGYVFQFDVGKGDRFVARTRDSWSEGVIEEVSMGDEFDINAEHEVSVSVEGNHHVIKVDGVIIMDFEDDTYSDGSAGIRTWHSGESDNSYSTFENFEVTEN